MLFGALVALAVGLGLRFAVTTASDLGPADLARFEEASGIDLPDWYGDAPFFLMWTRGDGATYLTLATDLDLDGAAHRLRSPRLRVARLGFSTLLRLVAIGRIAWLPVAAFVVGSVGLATYGAMTATIALHDRRAWWLLANPAVLIGYVGDSTEPVGLALLLVAALAVSPLVAFAAGALLGGVRPSFAPATLAARRPWPAFLGTIAVAAIVGTWARSVFPADPGFPFRLPLVGYVEATGTTPLPDLVVAATVAAAATGTIVLGVRRHRGPRRWGWILGGLLILTLPPESVDDVVNLLRIAGFLPVLWVLEGARDVRRVPEG